ncbi:hypothetical protein WL80_16760 [Burkholderia ubonensis]|uniref:DUF2169 family type VI secretion system accessory protein n=1 Tax=Burkholderia ubonensis TaxID=101571 RepID=UPI000754B8FB|nr:DUF2169 domain-containing protein [Burkholderia ubonensis]KVZ14048.1 hypothetical protein WL11_31890 [Burkholderia ubonensis]KWE89195.1 hypothetical protein WL80_16760 [Burkholderia ubonensis]
MEFSNHSPFPALAFESYTPDGASFHTIVLRQTFEFKNGALVLAQTQKPLATSDRFHGKPNQSSLAEESDLAPYKPFCDVLINGTANAPQGRPLPRFPIGVRIVTAPIRSDDDPGVATTKVLLDRKLSVTGQRYFVRRSLFARSMNRLVTIGTFGMVRPLEWKLTSAEPIVELPIRYEYAWGGQCRVDAHDPDAKHVPKASRLDDKQRAGHPDQENIPVAHTVCEDNPVGRGFAESWFMKATKPQKVAAPQIEAEGEPISVQVWLAASNGKGAPSLYPVGFGIIGKAWRSRRELAGTYDDQWLAERHPGLPDDFQFRYWNGAHPLMQVPHLKGNETVVLSNLVPAGTPGSTPDEQGNTIVRIALPGHLPMGWIYTDQSLKFAPLLLDTLSVDFSDASKPMVTLVWRATLMKSVRAQRFEARFVDRAELEQLAASSSTGSTGPVGAQRG